jgi:hypothetical protein
MWEGELKKALLIAGAMILAPAAHAQIHDGSFENKGLAGTIQNGGTPVTGYCYDLVNTGDGVCVDQSTWSGTGAVASGNGPWGGTLAADGNYFAFLQGNQSMSQTFTVSGAGTYKLNWLDANRTNYGGIQSYSVDITGVGSLGSFTTNYYDWRNESATFSLGAGSHTLTFTGLAAPGVDQTSFLDQVSLNKVSGAVPEPATWALMLGGFGLAGGMLRRRAGKLAHA